MPKAGTRNDRSDEPNQTYQLSEDDLKHLDSYNRKLQPLRDFTAEVALRRATGLFAYGIGGIGKSRAVLDELTRLTTPYRLLNSRVTGRGLFDELMNAPDAIHVLEDVEQMFREAGARGVLRSALWAQSSDKAGGPLERTVTWVTFRTTHEFIFTGGIIILGNRPLPDLPELDALKSRIACQHVEINDYEIRAVMRNIANQGYSKGADRIDPDECREVCEYVIETCQGLNRTIDIRLYVNSLNDYLTWRDGMTGCHWRDLVAARIKERATRIGEIMTPASRADLKKVEQDLVREILAATKSTAKRLEMWKEQTQKSQAAYYRRVAEVESSAN